MLFPSVPPSLCVAGGGFAESPVCLILFFTWDRLSCRTELSPFVNPNLSNVETGPVAESPTLVQVFAQFEPE